MPTGDTLQVIGLAVGMMACALTTSGWKKGLFWFLAVLFAFLSLVYADALPQFGLPLEGINRVITALLAPVILVGVAAMLREKRPAQSGVDFADIDPGPARPAFVASFVAKWKPDITFQQGIGYLGAKSVWPIGKMYSPSMKNAIDELTNALGDSQITA